MTSQPTAAKASPRLTQLQHGVGAATEQERNKKERVEDVVDASSGTRHRSHDQRMEQLASTAAVERVPAVEVTAALRRQRFAGALPSDEVTLSHAVSRGVAGTPRQVQAARTAARFLPGATARCLLQKLEEASASPKGEEGDSKAKSAAREPLPVMDVDGIPSAAASEAEIRRFAGANRSQAADQPTPPRNSGDSGWGQEGGERSEAAHGGAMAARSKWRALVGHCRKAPFDVYIGRASGGAPAGSSGEWGNHAAKVSEK